MQKNNMMLLPLVVIPRKKIPFMRVNIRETHRDGMVKPLPYYSASGCNEDGEKVGYADFMIPPTLDRIYINEIKIDRTFQRKGYGTRMLLEISHFALLEYGERLPITAIGEFDDAQDFWNKLRAGGIPELVVTHQVAKGELHIEAKRWGYKSFLYE